MGRPCDDCMGDIPNPRNGQRFCSDSCRAAHWRAIHEPRCYNCGVPLHITTGPPPRDRIARAMDSHLFKLSKGNPLATRPHLRRFERQEVS